MAKSNIEKLMELKQLYEQGILTKEEMEAEKAKILNVSTSSDETPTNETSPVETVKSSLTSTNNNKRHSHNNKIIIGVVAIVVVIIAALVALYHNKQKEPEEVAKDDVEQAQFSDDTYANYINIKDILVAIRESDSSDLITVLKKNGFSTDGKEDSKTSAIWTKVYGSNLSASDTISISWEKKEYGELKVSCRKDAIINKWITEINEIGYTFADSLIGNEEKFYSYNNKNGNNVLIVYHFSSPEKSLCSLTNFISTEENEDNSDDVRVRDDAYEYNFVGLIKGRSDQYPFKMALNINEEGKVSGYYIVTNGANVRVSLKGNVTNWPDKYEGEISLFEFDAAKNEYLGYVFQGDLTIEYSQSGSFAGFRINGRYTNAADIDWPFTAESM